ncbi:MAG: DUF1254 domain-containing protein [Thermomicrobiales bacterium]
MDRRMFVGGVLAATALHPYSVSRASEALRVAPWANVTHASGATPVAGSTPVAGASPRDIAAEAYVYGFPMVDNYRVMHAYFSDEGGPQFKTTWNTIYNTANVYTPADITVQTPNSDTPYSFVGADLRAEPLVLTVPSIEKGRYFSLQFIDLYTYNFAYVGSRTTGNDGGVYLLAGPAWDGEKPEGVDEVIHSDTDLALVIYRTQLFNPADIDNVRKIQSEYTMEPLSAFLGEPAPPPAPAIDFYPPLSADDERKDISFFDEFTFLLQFAPVVPAETELRARFASLGLAAGETFDAETQPADIQQALTDGMADAWKQLQGLQTELTSGKVSSGDLFGIRDYLGGNYLYRMAGAVLGIYGNSKQEALYPFYSVDATGQPLDGAEYTYSLRFGPDQLPPVNAFWSLTMYTLPESLLYANQLNRYLINSPMLPDLKKDADGGLTLYIQHGSPGADMESNWLPAPDGPFQMALRLYWPKETALDGTWTAPLLERESR